MADEFAPSVNDPASPTVGMDLDDDNRSIRSGSDEMLLSSTATTAIAAGKAYQFVERVLALHDRLKDPFVAASTPHMIQPLAVDDLVHTTERLLMTQAEFRAAGKPTTVDLGYHYTSRRNVDSIRTDGLQSRGELDTNHNPRTSGLLYGTGIYIATNPSAFNGPYGSVGLLVARLRGAEADYNMVGPNFDRGNDLAIIFRNCVNEFMVLPSSKQCCALLEFDAHGMVPFFPTHIGNLTVFVYHMLLQQIVDDFFNDGVSTLIQPLVLRGPHLWDNPTVYGAQSTSKALAYTDDMTIEPPQPPTDPDPNKIDSEDNAFLTAIDAALGPLPASATTPRTAFQALRASVTRAAAASASASAASHAAVAASTAAALYRPFPRSIPAIAPAPSRVIVSRPSVARQVPWRARRQHLSGSSAATGRGISSRPKRQRLNNRLHEEVDYDETDVDDFHIPCKVQYVAPRTLNDWKTKSDCYCQVPVVASARSNIHSSAAFAHSAASLCVICWEPLLDTMRNHTQGQEGVTPSFDGASCDARFNTVSSTIVKLFACGHHFHQQCIVQALGHSPKCPTCRTVASTPQGPMPSGTMTIEWLHDKRHDAFDSMTDHYGGGYIHGDESIGTILITYHIPRNVQQSYHPHPGVYHDGAVRYSCIAATDDGGDLVQRLKLAFCHGLTFTIGTSPATGRDHAVVWNGIHRKASSTFGGHRSHSFPRPHDFELCHRILDALNVPQADDIE